MNLSTYLKVYRRGDIVDIKVREVSRACEDARSSVLRCLCRAMGPFRRECRTSSTTARRGACST